MGGGGSTIGDLFYPDNPKRRRRAQELRDQINAYCAEFKQLAAQREQKLNHVRTKLDAVMASKGFATTKELEDYVRSILNSKQLADYDSFKEKQTLDLSDKVQGIIWDAIGIIGTASGVIIGGAVVLGFVTGGAALGAIATIGEVLGIIAAIVIVWGVIEGAIERSKLRDAIDEMWPQRAKVKQAMEQMRVVVNWVDALDVWLNNDVTSDPEILDKLLNAGFEPEYKSWTMDRVYNILLQMDRNNGSWTDEDPGRGSLNAAFATTALVQDGDEIAKDEAEIESSPVIDARMSTEDGSLHEKGTLAYESLLSEESCVVTYEGIKWKLTAVKWDKNKPELSTAMFSMEPFEEMPSETKASLSTKIAGLECFKMEILTHSSG